MNFSRHIVIFAAIGLAIARAANAGAMTVDVRADVQAMQIALEACHHQQQHEPSITTPPLLEQEAIHHQPAFYGGMAVLFTCLHEPARSVLRFAAHGTQQGDALSEVILGTLYQTGIPGVLAANPSKAMQLHMRSADQGLAYGELALGNDYYHGTGVAKNPEKAFFWWHLAAQQGVPNAEAVMGYAYLHGIGVAPDAGLARKWLQQAADHGSQPAIGWLKQHPPTQALAAMPAPPTQPSPQPAPTAESVAASPTQPTAPAAAPVADNQQALQNLQRFWTLYFQASNAHVVDFGEPALVRPVGFGTPP
ncbi:MAG: tetratricopeptide repeat protein [Acidiferrobacteraceae bacterium]